MLHDPTSSLINADSGIFLYRCELGMKEQALSAKFHLPFSLTTMKATGRVPRTNENTEQGRQGCSFNTDIKVSIFENEIAVKKKSRAVGDIKCGRMI